MKGIKSLCFMLVLALCVGVTVPVLAVSDDTTPNVDAIEAANRLYELGLFSGVGNNADGTPNFDLARTLNRMEAVTMLVRLLGKEDEALAGSQAHTFTDVEDWARPYVTYAQMNGLTSGTSETTFGGTDTVTATQYLTFILRALGYSSDGDFAWDAAWELTDELGITNGEYGEGVVLSRGDAVLISANALDVKMNYINNTLLGIITNTPPAMSDNELLMSRLNGFWNGIEQDGNEVQYAFTSFVYPADVTNIGAVAVFSDEEMLKTGRYEITDDGRLFAYSNIDTEVDSVLFPDIPRFDNVYMEIQIDDSGKSLLLSSIDENGAESTLALTKADMPLILKNTRTPSYEDIDGLWTTKLTYDKLPGRLEGLDSILFYHFDSDGTNYEVSIHSPGYSYWHKNDISDGDGIFTIDKYTIYVTPNVLRDNSPKFIRYYEYDPDAANPEDRLVLSVYAGITESGELRILDCPGMICPDLKASYPEIFVNDFIRD